MRIINLKWLRPVVQVANNKHSSTVNTTNVLYSEYE
jgi:hypothetical protein